MIFRARYSREGKDHFMTFSRRNAALAALYAYTVLSDLVKRLDPKSEIIEIIPFTTKRKV